MSSKYAVSVDFKDLRNGMRTEGTVTLELEAENEVHAGMKAQDRLHDARGYDLASMTVRKSVLVESQEPDVYLQLSARERRAMRLALSFLIANSQDEAVADEGYSEDWLGTLRDRLDKAGQRIVFGLTDQAAEHAPVPLTGWVDLCNGTLAIGLEGYGDKTSEAGQGLPIYLEVYNGQPRLSVWDDINQEDPTHVVSLSGARETAREDTHG